MYVCNIISSLFESRRARAHPLTVHNTRSGSDGNDADSYTIDCQQSVLVFATRAIFYTVMRCAPAVLMSTFGRNFFSARGSYNNTYTTNNPPPDPYGSRYCSYRSSIMLNACENFI